MATEWFFCGSRISGNSCRYRDTTASLPHILAVCLHKTNCKGSTQIANFFKLTFRVPPSSFGSVLIRSFSGEALMVASSPLFYGAVRMY